MHRPKYLSWHSIDLKKNANNTPSKLTKVEAGICKLFFEVVQVLQKYLQVLIEVRTASKKKKTISENMKSKPPLVLSVHSSSLFFECTALNIYSYVKWINASTTSGVLAWVSKSRANMHDCRIITKEGRKPKSKLTKECSVVTHTLWLLHIPLLHQRCPGRQLFGIWTVCRRLGGRVKHRPWVNVHTSHTHIHTLGQAGSGGATWIRCIHGRRCQCALVLATQTCRHLRR